MDVKRLIDKTVSLYSGFGWKRIFAKLRFWYAPFIEVESLLPRKGVIIDLGCGEGIFANFLGLASKDREVLGIDLDEKRLRIANRGVSNVSFTLKDITKIAIPRADGIVLFQVLHHLHSFQEQENIIRNCAKRLNKGGKLIIVEIYVKFSLQYVLSWIADYLLVAWFFERRLYTPILFRKLEEWVSLFKDSELSCNSIIPKGRMKPFSNVILECQK